MVDELNLHYNRDRELLYRWMEYSAVVDVIFRSHQGILWERCQPESPLLELRCLADAPWLSSSVSRQHTRAERAGL